MLKIALKSHNRHNNMKKKQRRPRDLRAKRWTRENLEFFSSKLRLVSTAAMKVTFNVYNPK
jgi:ABC-type lipoprotein release transport system permease subunit